MSTIVQVGQKAISSRRALMTGGIIFLSTALVAIYFEIMTAQVIAPPGLRILDFLWRAFNWLGI